ncbi:MAG TPA: xylanase, partial [Armatimonadota bacterium]|nr:xylanase [Armatimonadota bacterium]
PFFLAHDTDDRISEVDHSVVMYLSLKRAGVSAELHAYAAGGHGLGVRPGPHPSSTWTARFVDWLRDRGIIGEADGARQRGPGAA